MRATDEVDLAKPIASLRLSNGRILQSATLAEFKSTGVLIRHKGGSAFVLYEALPDAVRNAAEAKRPGGARVVAGEVAAQTEIFTGQVFVQTRGNGPYKFGGVDVYAFEIGQLSQFDGLSRPIRLPRPIAQAQTDGDGKFRLIVPAGASFFVFAQASRLSLDGYALRSEWRLPWNEIKKPDAVYLTGDNALKYSGAVEIEPPPTT